MAVTYFTGLRTKVKGKDHPTTSHERPRAGAQVYLHSFPKLGTR